MYSATAINKSDKWPDAPRGESCMGATQHPISIPAESATVIMDAFRGQQQSRRFRFYVDQRVAEDYRHYARHQRPDCPKITIGPGMSWNRTFNSRED